jgi:hypothetical protein
MGWGAIGTALGAIGGLASAFMGRKLPKLPDPVLEQAQVLADLPASPQRDAYIKQFSQNADAASALYNKTLPTYSGAVDQYAQQAGQIGQSLTGIQNAMLNTASNNPYLNYASNPLALKQEQQGILENYVNQSYDPLGTKGSALQNNLANISGEAARRGISGSGIALRAGQEANLATQGQKAEALTKGLGDINNQLLGWGQLYNQGQQNTLTGQRNAAEIGTQQANIYKSVPDMYGTLTSNAAKWNEGYGLDTTGLEQQGRTEQIQKDMWNKSNAQNVANRNADRQNNFTLSRYNVGTQEAMSRPSVGQAISGIGGALAGMGSFGGSSSGGGGSGSSGGSNPAPAFADSGSTPSNMNYFQFQPSSSPWGIGNITY